MYINDIPNCSEFDTTLFVDDTYLTLSDSNLENLEKRVNKELQNVDNWLRRNKLSLNFNKKNYMIFNKHPAKTVDIDFNLTINGISLERVHSVKYLGVVMDDKLTWAEHLKQLSLQLARYSGIFYRLQNVITQKTLIMLYYSVIYSRVQYGIALWRTAAKARLQEINVRLNNIVRSITRSGKYVPVTPLYKHLNILKLDDIYRLELAKIMYQLRHHLLPKTLQVSFTKVSDIHEHYTRFTENSGYFLSRVNKSIG